jgi:hypothetical protein
VFAAVFHPDVLPRRPVREAREAMIERRASSAAAVATRAGVHTGGERLAAAAGLFFLSAALWVSGFRARKS